MLVELRYATRFSCLKQLQCRESWPSRDAAGPCGVVELSANTPPPRNPQVAEKSRSSGAALKTKWRAEERIGQQCACNSFEAVRLSGAVWVAPEVVRSVRG
ncbi:hypothetical protein NDU88_004902 [Pleurodeles waltl]|uniref:Uncharacterized protein n=1 Tax=Pleurodeles waltl TaxID=8319 RepID=A0AAV7LN23_PLEWA|nr:hypothetical protein NDU88_004902 [Pleurodeles waltl]